MNINEVKELLAKFDQSTLTEFDLTEGNFELYMNKNKDSRRQAAPAPVAPAAPVPAPAVTSETAPGATTAPKAAPSGHIVKSPIVGVVYLQPSPDKPAFKAVGEKVKKGDVLCIVEAMKLMNEIVSDKDGTVTEVLIENEAVVEFGQPLFCISEV